MYCNRFLHSNRTCIINSSVTGNDASCNGVCDGDATAVAAGGTGCITYQWDAAGGLGTTATTTSTLCAGTAGCNSYRCTRDVQQLDR